MSVSRETKIKDVKWDVFTVEGKETFREIKGLKTIGQLMDAMADKRISVPSVPTWQGVSLCFTPEDTGKEVYVGVVNYTSDVAAERFSYGTDEPIVQRSIEDCVDYTFEYHNAELDAMSNKEKAPDQNDWIDNIAPKVFAEKKRIDEARDKDRQMRAAAAEAEKNAIVHFENGVIDNTDVKISLREINKMLYIHIVRGTTADMIVINKRAGVGDIPYVYDISPCGKNDKGDDYVALCILEDKVDDGEDIPYAIDIAFVMTQVGLKEKYIGRWTNNEAEPYRQYDAETQGWTLVDPMKNRV